MIKLILFKTSYKFFIMRPFYEFHPFFLAIKVQFLFSPIGYKVSNSIILFANSTLTVSTWQMNILTLQSAAESCFFNWTSNGLSCRVFLLNKHSIIVMISVFKFWAFPQYITVQSVFNENLYTPGALYLFTADLLLFLSAITYIKHYKVTLKIWNKLLNNN